uniref:Osteopetrosis-associated transmembrane protein 1 n=1 Tax=Culex pipiens TaxID=7175 RepID=A0A8D8MMR1_CULPI
MLILKFIVGVVLLTSPTLAKKPHPHPIPPQGNCNQIEQFAGQFENFFKQVPLYVYPAFTICSNDNITQYYKDAMTIWANATADHICQVMNFERRSKSNPAVMMHDQLVSFWTTANCQDCLDRRNQTVEFFAEFAGLDGCIKQESDQALSPCEPCADTYQKVQGMYEALAKGHKETLCFDVEDRMNQTRHRWSAEFNCCKNKQHSKTSFIGAASAFCSVPLVFYAIMFFVTRRKERVEELVAGVTRDAEPQAGTSREGMNGMVVEGGGAEEDDSDDEPIGRKEIDGEEEFQAERKLNNLDVIRENDEPKEGQLLDIVSNTSGSTVDVNLDLSGMKGVSDEEDDVSILGAMKANVVVERNLLD